VDKAFIVRENGNALRVIGAIQDITEYKQLQEKLVFQEEGKKRAVVRSIIETQEKERRQLSVELHDNVNQILSSCKLMLEVAKENKDKAPVLTEKSYQSIQLAIEEIRKISHDLNPSSVEDFGLKDAITEMIDKINLSGKLKIVFRFVMAVKKMQLKSEDKIAIYRIVQEQLNNIVKHAQAKNVLVDLSINLSEVHLLIEDDGKGFNTKKINKGIGLKNIHHRVEYYHGTFTIKSAKNKGSKMSIVLNIASNTKK
jgi:two-component system sensor histidine kinase UhpB